MSTNNSDDTSSQYSTTSEKETLFIQGIHKFYRFLGKYVARYPWFVVFICTALTVVGCIKIKHTPRKSDLAGYAPPGARSRYEHAVYEEFFDYSGQGIQVLLMVMAKDNGTLLRDEYLKDTVEIIDYVNKNFTIYNKGKDKNETFEDFCYGFCLYNEPVRQFYNGWQIQKMNSINRIHLAYPITSMFGRQFSLQPNFFGIEKYTNNELKNLNNTVVTNMKSVKMIVLQFRAERNSNWTDEQVKEYEIAVSEYFTTKYQSDNLRVLTISVSFVQKEIQRGGLKLQPFLLVGFAIMTTFTIITTLISADFAHQASWYKVINAIFACVVPFMSVAASFGLLFFAGVRFGPIILVTPFLILAIGVDDSFLMMHAWQRIVTKLNKNPISNDSIEYRISEVLAEAGPSITISALTNIMAFTVGALTSPPEVELFCITNAFAIFFDTVFSVTLYAAEMAICGRREMIMKAKNPDKSESIIGKKYLSSFKKFASNFIDNYVKILTNVYVSISIIILFFIYLIISVYGATTIGIDLSTQKFFLKDSVLLEADRLRTEYVIPYFTPVSIIVNNPGNLTNIKRIKKLNEFVHDFEELPGAIGTDATKYFMRDYQEYKDPFSEDENEIKPFDPNDLNDFLEWPEYTFWKGFLQTKKNETKTVLNKFFFNIGFEGDELKDWVNRSKLLRQWRDEVDKYKDEFNATVFSDDAIFMDLIEVIPSVTFQSALATLVCMAIACFLFMFDPFTVIVASLSISSICLGTFGFLNFWGITQDPIMMAAIIMSIGFSVDIPAHIAFHYYRTSISSDQMHCTSSRIKHTLEAVGFPVIQAGTSTILCVLSLLCVSLYMSEVFFKSMTLCILLGLIHGLFIMPAIFYLYDLIKDKCSKKDEKKAFHLTRIRISSNKIIPVTANPA